MHPHEKLIEAWIKDEYQPPDGGMGEPAVAELEHKYGLRLPTDFRDYLLHASPAHRSEQLDGYGTDWWAVSRIKTIPEEYDHPVANPVVAGEADVYLFFADFAIWCWAWAINCGTGANRGRVVCIGGTDDFVADSFAEFVDAHVVDYRSVGP
jgi:hypothetical protein